MRVYLDTNVLLDVLDERVADLGALIRESVAKKTHEYPFSGALISEVTSSQDEERNNKRLSAISGISGDMYFGHTVYELGFMRASPVDVYKTLNEVPFATAAAKMLSQLISFESLRAAREAMGLSPSELNNLSPDEAISRIESALANFQSPAGAIVKAPRSLADVLRFLRGIQRVTSSSLWARMNGNLEKMLSNNDLVVLFSLFDALGFWPDDRGSYDKGSRFADSQHAFNASHYDVLVSRDRRFRMKATASYGYFGVKVRVQSTDEFIQSLR